MIFKIYIAVAILVLTSTVVVADACEAKVYRRGPVVGIDGCISETVAARFKKVADSGVQSLVIRSVGGEVPASIAIAKIVEKNRMIVVLRDFCMSSCVNYIFAAGRRRYVEEGGTMLLHGDTQTSVSTDALKNFPPAVAAGIAKILADEKHFQEGNEWAKKIHKLQLMVMKQGEVVNFKMDGMRYECAGFGRSPWLLQIDTGLKLNIVNGVHAGHFLLAKEMPSAQIEIDSGAFRLTPEKLKSCLYDSAR